MQPTTISSSALASPTGTAPAPRKRGKAPSTLDLLRLAKAAGKFASKKLARETLKSAGFITTEEVIQDLLNTLEFIRTAKRNRSANTIFKRLGHTPTELQVTTRGRPPILLPKSNPILRLDAIRAKAVTAQARSMFRSDAAGGHSMKVFYASDASNVNYEVVMDQNRTTYAGAYKGWAANEDHHRITVPRDWRPRVQRKGLANLDGLMTLDAHPLMSDGDVQIYAATWARQGRGYDVQVDRGFIALQGHEHFHADTAEAAVKGVLRKAKLAGGPAHTASSPYKLSVVAFVKRYSGRNITVAVTDATDSGSCDFGIRSWCQSVGLDYEVGKAPMKEVLNGFLLRPQEEVRRAVVHAVRRHRSESRAKKR